MGKARGRDATGTWALGPCAGRRAGELCALAWQFSSCSGLWLSRLSTFLEEPWKENGAETAAEKGWHWDVNGSGRCGVGVKPGPTTM